MTGAAVIGTGFISSLHIDALRRMGVEVRGVLARDAAAVRARGTYARVYEDLDEVCADPGVDVVHVTTPNNLHSAQTRRILAAGKHVVCEKPLGMSVDEGVQMLAAAEAAGVVHAVCFNVRFNPVVHHARDLVRSDELGPVHLVTGAYLQDWLLLPTDWNWRVDPDAGGRLRAVADIGSHWLDLVRFVTGLRVTEVMADLSTVIPVRNRPMGSIETFTADRVGDVPREDVAVSTEDAAGLLLRFDSGARGVLTVSQVSAGRKNSCRLEVSAARGTVAWNSEQPEQLWLGHRDQPNAVLTRDPALLSASARAISHYPPGHPEGFAESFLGMLERVYAAVAAGGPPEVPDYPTFADGLEGLFIEDAVLESAQKQSWATVSRRTS